MAHWREIALGDICELKYGRSLPESKRRSGQVPVFGSNGRVGFHDNAVSQGETIVVGRKGSFGEVNFSPVPCWPIDTTYYVDRSSTDTDLRWLSYRLRALGLNRLNRAAAIPGLNREDAYRQRLLLPPLAEQRRIAEILDKADALRAKCRAGLAQLDTLTQSIFLDMFGDRASRNWSRVQLGSLCEKVIDCPHATPVYTDRNTEFFCLRSSDIQNGQLALRETLRLEEPEFKARTARGVPQIGDVIYCREGARFGNAARITQPVSVCLGQRMMLFRPKKGEAVSEYLWSFLRSADAYRQASMKVGGSASPHINIRDIVAFEVVKAPLDLQTEFARAVHVIDRLRSSAEAMLSGLDVLFASLQYRAFRGEL